MKNNWTGERLETYIFNEATIEHLHRYAIATEYGKGKVVLDIACGEGYGTNLLGKVALSVTGVDIDQPTIKRAKAKYKNPALTFLTGSIESIPCNDNSFDIAISFETLEHTSEHEKMMKEIKRVLKPGGLLIISTPDKKNYCDKPGYKNPFHLKELYQDEFRLLLQNNFIFIKLLSQASAYSSIAWQDAPASYNHYEGSYLGLSTYSPLQPVYYIAFASDADLPEISNSIFRLPYKISSLLEQKEQEIKKTITYSVGHAITLPLKLLRSLFSK